MKLIKNNILLKNQNELMSTKQTRDENRAHNRIQ